MTDHKFQVKRTTKRYVNGVLTEETTVIEESDSPEIVPEETQELFNEAMSFHDRIFEWMKNMPRFR